MSEMEYSEIDAAIARVERHSLASSELEGVPISWIPLVTIDSHGLQLGLDVAGQWVLGSPGSVAVRSGEKLPSGWLCILDLSEDDFFSALRIACQKYGIPYERLSRLVPVDDVLALALRSGSGHWTQRASGWLLKRTPNSEHLGLLREVVNKTWLPQPARQAAAKILRRGM